MAAIALLRRAITQKILNAARNYSSNPLQHIDPVQAQKAFKMWKTLSLTVVPVALTLGFLNVYLNEHEEEPPEFIPYEHLRIRTKSFPWGDGQHSFFHNSRVNPLPTGYEN
ncbi:cytochrome c oxidase subunit 6A1, mitochondrial-like [Phymastichus coffea]|uniref:cytochrome c oxidase subunit 6A1, mitochondrial-like n=1 Tax=Phymastichus coffea TaxID=108790 RepID=UPI00273AA655|nr:cytochrome c oxidase subunit 6A1, mitochondrial-like [Phymastichus coffea]